jgi:hypothetical protein
VCVADGKTQVFNGPYAENREQLRGYYLIDVPDLDAALSWAARCRGPNTECGQSGRYDRYARRRSRCSGRGGGPRAALLLG